MPWWQPGQVQQPSICAGKQQAGKQQAGLPSGSASASDEDESTSESGMAAPGQRVVRCQSCSEAHQ